MDLTSDQTAALTGEVGWEFSFLADDQGTYLAGTGEMDRVDLSEEAAESLRGKEWKN